jgi:hypothetical protein
MTQINYTELALLKTLDQGIVWAVLSLHRANTDPTNVWYSDNASVRQTVAKNLVNWRIGQDDEGIGRFTFSAMMPLVDKDPMVNQADVCEIIKSYSAFLLIDQLIDPPTSTKGFPMPPLPAYVETMEQLLFFLCRIAAAINLAIRRALAAIKEKPETSFNLPIDTSGVIPIVDFGALGSPNPSTKTAAGIIYQFLPPDDIHLEFDALLSQALGSLASTSPNGIPTSSDIDEGQGYREQGIETLPVCQEQDPSILNLSDGDVINLLSKTA